MEFNLNDQSTSISRSDFLRYQKTLKDDLNRVRQRIDVLRDRGLGKQFSFAVRYVNPYEDMSLPSLSISSRAFFKMYEILKRFNLLSYQHPYQHPYQHQSQHPCQHQSHHHFKTLHLCEAPGSFVEATQEYIKRNFPQSIHEWYGVTLREGLEWTSDSSNVIYANIITDELPDKVKQSILVTGDGGFEIESNDKNNQELLNTPLLKGQIRHAIESVACDGSIVIKMFDMFEEETCELLWSCCKSFKKLYLSKPFGSRICNSERYIVGIGYQNDNLINNQPSSIPDWFYGALWNANRRIVQLQMQSLNQAIEMVNRKVDTRKLDQTKKKEKATQCLKWMGLC
jgi:23S rRNA U2552 (ribose-2'-O)-methylase RlmE/FtsJ